METSGNKELVDFKCPHCGTMTKKEHSEKSGYFYECPDCGKKFKAKESQFKKEETKPVKEERKPEPKAESPKAETKTETKTRPDTVPAVESSDVDEATLMPMVDVKGKTQTRIVHVYTSEEPNIYAIAALVTGILSAFLPTTLVTIILSVIAGSADQREKRFADAKSAGLMISLMMFVLKAVALAAWIKFGSMLPLSING